jgi:Bacterial Ig-like domain (group 2)
VFIGIDLRGFVPLTRILFALSLGAALRGDVINVPDGGNLQAAINSAQPGDTLVLAAGSTYTGNFVLPYKGDNTDYITITSSNLSALPPADHRVSPADSVNMPKLLTPSTDSALTVAEKANHYRVIGIEFLVSSGFYCFNMVSVGTPFNTDPAAVAHDIELDRIYVHGDPVNGTKFGVYLNGGATTVKNSYISQIASTFQDAIGIVGIFGPGPYWILNNYVEAAGENVYFAPASNYPGVGIEANIPSDVVIRGNYLRKPLSWRAEDPSYAGIPWIVKNLLELKAGRRFLIEGNVLENNWIQSQNGFSILLTLRAGGDPNTVIRDITFRYNIVRHVAGAFNIQGKDDDGLGSSFNEYIHDNIFEDITQSLGGNGYMFQDVGGTDGLAIDHNTCFQEFTLLAGWVFPTYGLSFTNNIAPLAGYGVIAAGTAPGTRSLDAYFPGWVFQKNVLVGDPANYPTSNSYLKAYSDVGFVDRTGGDYHLLPSSPYKNAGTDGRDAGADIDAVLAATAGAVAGFIPASSAVSISPQSLSLKGAATQQFTATVSGSPNQTVTWTITPSVGSISSSGLYTAPVLVTSVQDIRITATSVADPTQAASVFVTLVRSLQVNVTINPQLVQLAPAQQQQFTASSTGGSTSAVTWTITPQLGSISSSGVYTASASGSAQQDVRITATSVADPTHEASAYVTLAPAVPVAVAVSPAAVYLSPAQQQQFVSAVTGGNTSAVTWAVTPALGSIAASGLYTAPGGVATQQDVRITATSIADPTHEANAYVTLLPLLPVVVGVSPVAAQLSASQQQQFTVTVGGGKTVAVNWTITPALGSISSSGVYMAPASVAAQQDVRVTVSVADSIHEATAYVTLLPSVTTGPAASSKTVRHLK